GGKRAEAGALVDEFELAGIERLHAEPDAERIEDAVALAVAHGDVGRPMGHNPFIVERHRPTAPALRRGDRPAASRSPCPRPAIWRMPRRSAPSTEPRKRSERPSSAHECALRYPGEAA